MNNTILTILLLYWFFSTVAVLSAIIQMEKCTLLNVLFVTFFSWVIFPILIGAKLVID